MILKCLCLNGVERSLDIIEISFGLDHYFQFMQIDEQAVKKELNCARSHPRE